MSVRCIHCGGTIIYSDGRCFMCGRLQQQPVTAAASKHRTLRFGEIIKDYRHEHGLTQKQTAAILGVPPGYISYWENFNREPRNAQELLDKLK